MSMHSELVRMYDAMLTLTGRGASAVVCHPDRLSQAMITLHNGWSVSVTVSPGVCCSMELLWARLSGEVPDDPLGRNGSPEGWFDLAPDAEVGILRPNGSWYRCERTPCTNPLPSWPYVTADELAEIIARVETQPDGCLCPECCG